MKSRLRRRAILFLALLLAAFLILDHGVESAMEPYILSSGRFWLNDYELTRRAHPEKVWDKVFFGNSVVIAAYREQDSASGFINFGIDCGVVRDLWEMIQKKTITVGSELVVALNELTLYDDFDTNATYPWHRKTLEPYCYFQRDHLRELLEQDMGGRLLKGEGLPQNFLTQEKQTYSGSMTQAELEEKMASESYAKYLDIPQSDFDENFAAMDKLADYCARHDIRLRVVWMPRNPLVYTPDSTAQVYERAEQFCAQRGVEFRDMRNALDVSCFYDIGHLNYEYGAYVFTEMMDQWLLS